MSNGYSSLLSDLRVKDFSPYHPSMLKMVPPVTQDQYATDKELNQNPIVIDPTMDVDLGHVQEIEKIDDHKMNAGDHCTLEAGSINVSDSTCDNLNHFFSDQCQALDMDPDALVGEVDRDSDGD
ncbi:hypothetical protein R6Q59_009135 [Mikania micrantha]